jgi:hypothetical protein
VRQLVQLYNRLAERSLQLGTLVVEGGDTRPSVVMLVPNPAWEMEQPEVEARRDPRNDGVDGLRPGGVPEGQPRFLAPLRQRSLGGR